MNNYDVIIVGAGPSGLFAAYELLNNNCSILVVDEGMDVFNRTCSMGRTNVCTHCEVCSILSGVGGSGTYSDGTLNLRYDIGGNLRDFTKDAFELWIGFEGKEIQRKTGAHGLI